MLSSSHCSPVTVLRFLLSTFYFQLSKLTDPFRALLFTPLSLRWSRTNAGSRRRRRRRFGRKEIRQDDGLARTAAPKHNPTKLKLPDEFPKWGKIDTTGHAGRRCMLHVSGFIRVHQHDCICAVRSRRRG